MEAEPDTSAPPRVLDTWLEPCPQSLKFPPTHLHINHFLSFPIWAASIFIQTTILDLCTSYELLFTLTGSCLLQLSLISGLTDLFPPFKM